LKDIEHKGRTIAQLGGLVGSFMRSSYSVPSYTQIHVATTITRHQVMMLGVGLTMKLTGKSRESF